MRHPNAWFRRQWHCILVRRPEHSSEAPFEIIHYTVDQQVLRRPSVARPKTWRTLKPHPWTTLVPSVSDDRPTIILVPALARSGVFLALLWPVDSGEHMTPQSRVSSGSGARGLVILLCTMLIHFELSQALLQQRLCTIPHPLPSTTWQGMIRRNDFEQVRSELPHESTHGFFGHPTLNCLLCTSLPPLVGARISRL